MVEAINSADVPRFPIDSSDAAIALIDTIPADNVAFLADLYHLATMGEDLTVKLAAQGYTGSVGLEYVPLDRADSSTSFGWP